MLPRTETPCRQSIRLRKLGSWAKLNADAISNALLLAMLFVLTAATIWQGVANGP